MTFWQLATLRGILFFILMLHEGASYERAEENGHSGSPDPDDLQLQIASEPPIKSTVDALNCVSGGAERALKRNLHMNSKTGDAQMMDANALRMGEAKELRDEAELHQRRAQEIEDVKQKQKNRHSAAMKKIQDDDQTEVGEMERELELIKEAETTAKRDLEEEEHLLNEAEARAPREKGARLQQQNTKHKSREEIATLMQYPLLGFSVPSALNPVEYLNTFKQSAAASHPSLEVADGHETPSAAGARKLAAVANRQEMHDRVEILGDDAMLEELQKKKAKGRKSGKAKKKHSAKTKKRRMPAQNKKEEETETATEESEEESGPAKALHDIEDAVAAPFGGGKEESTFNNATIKTANAQQQKATRPQEDLNENSERRVALSTNTKDTDDDDDNDDGDDGKKNMFSHKCGGKCSDADDDDEEGEEPNKECTACKKEQHVTVKSPVEATEAESSQARTLQQQQLGQTQQSLLQLTKRHESQHTQQPNTMRKDRIRTTIDSARARFAATRATARAASDGGEDDDDAEQIGESELAQENMQPKNGTSEAAAATGTEGKAKKDDMLAVEEAEAAAEALAAEKEAHEAESSLEDEHKLLAAEQEANQARSGLKVCAEGSFLNCRQARRAKRSHPIRGGRMVL